MKFPLFVYKISYISSFCGMFFLHREEVGAAPSAGGRSETLTLTGNAAGVPWIGAHLDPALAICRAHVIIVPIFG